jgi:uncharacterized RDD family membrane protein YckC
VTVTTASTTDQPYAGLVTRAVAFALDVAILDAILIVIGVVVGLIISAFGDFAPDLGLGEVALGIVGWALAFTAYFVTFWSLTGQTPGMRALGIKVVPVKGDRVRPLQGFVRVAGMLAAAIPLFAGYLLILVQNRRQGLQDLIARTLVLYVERERPPARHRSA